MRVLILFLSIFLSLNAWANWGTLNGVDLTSSAEQFECDDIFNVATDETGSNGADGSQWDNNRRISGRQVTGCVYHASQFGALPDDATDDSVDIVAACAAIGNNEAVIQFEPGVYTMSADAIDTCRNVKFLGAGKDLTTFDFTSLSSGNYTNFALMYFTGSALSSLGSLASDAAEGARTITLSSAPSVSQGDLVFIYNATDYSFGGMKFELPYDAQTVNFTAGLVVTGGTSGCQVKILEDTDGGATGTLKVAFSNGTACQDNETITDSGSGSATVNLASPTNSDYGLNDVTDGFEDSYRAGEICEVLSVSGSVITCRDPLVDSYESTDVTVYASTSPGSIHFEGITVEAPTDADHNCLRVELMQHFTVKDARFVNCTASAVLIEKSIDWSIRFNDIGENGADNGTDYGVSISNSQDGRVIGNKIYARRHAIACGGADETGAVPSRKWIASNNLMHSNAAAAGDAHGNCEDYSYTDNIVYGGFVVGGDNITVSNNKIYGPYTGNGGKAVSTRELAGTTIRVTGNDVYSDEEAASNGGAFFDVGSNTSTVLTEDTTRGGLINLSGNSWNWSLAGENSAEPVSIRNRGSVAKYSLLMDANLIFNEDGEQKGDVTLYPISGYGFWDIAITNSFLTGIDLRHTVAGAASVRNSFKLIGTTIFDADAQGVIAWDIQGDAIVVGNHCINVELYCLAVWGDSTQNGRTAKLSNNLATDVLQEDPGSSSTEAPFLVWYFDMVYATENVTTMPSAGFLTHEISFLGATNLFHDNNVAIENGALDATVYTNTITNEYTLEDSSAGAVEWAN